MKRPKTIHRIVRYLLIIAGASWCIFAVATGITDAVLPNNPLTRPSAAEQKLLDESARIARIEVEQEERFPTHPHPVPRPALVADHSKKTVRIDIACDPCRTYGESVASAIRTAVRQSDNFDYAYSGFLIDAQIVVAERDGSVYVDMLTESGANRITQNIATFHKSGDMLNAGMIANAIYEVYTPQTARQP